MHTYANVKTQSFIFPDGTTATFETSQNIQYILACSDPEWRVIAKAVTKAGIEKELARYRRIWPDDNTLTVIKRDSFKFTYRE